MTISGSCSACDRESEVEIGSDKHEGKEQNAGEPPGVNTQAYRVLHT